MCARWWDAVWKSGTVTVFPLAYLKMMVNVCLSRCVCLSVRLSFNNLDTWPYFSDLQHVHIHSAHCTRTVYTHTGMLALNLISICSILRMIPPNRISIENALHMCHSRHLPFALTPQFILYENALHVISGNFFWKHNEFKFAYCIDKHPEIRYSTDLVGIRAKLFAV